VVSGESSSAAAVRVAPLRPRDCESAGLVARDACAVVENERGRV
jgi:hypothetical protein